MTSDELIERAAKLGGWELRPWRGDPLGLQLIRRGHDDCPLTAVAQTKTSWQAAKRLNISTVGARRIVMAADGRGSPRIRAKMLRAFGLAEGEAAP